MSRLLGKKGRAKASTFTVDGITDTLVGWAKRLGTNYHCLYKRIVLRGIDPIEAIRQGGEHQNRNFITIDGETHYLNEWSRITGVPEKVIHRRISLGWEIEEALGIKKHDSKGAITWRGKTKTQKEWAEYLGLSHGAFCGRVREWRAGSIPKKDLFRKETGQTGRPHFSQMKYYKGKRRTITELAEMKGVGRTWFWTKLNEGISVYNIMEHEVKLDAAECARRNALAQRRKHRLEELRKAGLLV